MGKLCRLSEIFTQMHSAYYGGRGLVGETYYLNSNGVGEVLESLKVVRKVRLCSPSSTVMKWNTAMYARCVTVLMLP